MNKLAVVTGGTRGLGAAIGAVLAGAGYQVVALGRRRPDAGPPDGVGFIACDVATPASVVEAFAQLRAAHGRIDVLVNNAGVAGADRLGDPLDPQWDRLIDTNLSGAYRCTQAALPLFPAEGGRIVFVSSVLGLRAVPDQIAYTASKHGVIGLAKAFALALAPRGITSNAVCPGWIATDMARSRYAELGIDEDGARRGVPTGSILQPEEVAAAVLYLCSDAARNVTGHSLVIDGGATA
ncbi:MAG: SDR family oxidoreductase [Burkholderiales bacterium]|nr:SDR family oxidoreductase [Burkholderiales bacterium]